MFFSNITKLTEWNNIIFDVVQAALVIPLIE